MPVKVDTSRCCSPTPFDCDLLSEFEQELVNEICLSTSYDEDCWGSLMPTPPQSPQIKLDFMDFNLDSFLDDSLETDFDQKLINHDCMWSGQCSEGRCRNSYKPVRSSLSNSWTRSMETSFNLSTSPINTFSDIAPYELNLHENSLNNFMEEEVQEPTVEGNVYAMANDHSYESSSPVSAKEDSEDENTQTESSLINKNPIKILNAGKITKIKCKKIVHKKPLLENSSSILNSNINHRPAPVKSSETSVLKPTIISVANVANFKSLDGGPKFKLINPTIKKKKMINFLDPKSAVTRPTIQIKKVPNFSTNISMISPSSSDSEESSVSFSSGDDNRKTSPPFRRREHNDSERKRRDHLRNSFNNLKDQIPKLKSSEKRPPRIMILHEATEYVTNLIHINTDLEDTLRAEQEKKKRLLSILKNLKDSC